MLSQLWQYYSKAMPPESTAKKLMLEFGPRIAMAEFLCDIPLDAGTPLPESLCGSCTRCTDNCAYNAIHGVLWYPGIPREEQVDYARCSTCRFAGFEKLGRKIACGRCMAACPFGSKTVMEPFGGYRPPDTTSSPEIAV